MEKEKQKEFISEDVRENLKDALKQLTGDVLIEVYTKDDVNEMFNEFAINLTRVASEVNSKIRVDFHKIGDEVSKKRGVQRSPTTAR